MKNLVLITSIIYPPSKPLSYIETRSIYTPERRFEDTKKIIESIKTYIPNSIIFIIECSRLTDEQYTYFKCNSDIFVNLIDYPSYIESIYSSSKSLGEGTMTIYALEYLIENNIEFDQFFKISGRYWLTNDFKYENFYKFL